MIVYVVTKGSYDDYQMDRMFATLELAQQYLALARMIPNGYEYNDDIEEWPIHTTVPELVRWWSGNMWWNQVSGWNKNGPDIRDHAAFSDQRVPDFVEHVIHGQAKSNKHEGIGKDENGSWLYYPTATFRVTAATREEVVAGLARLKEESGLK